MSRSELHFPDISKVFPGAGAKPASIPLPASTGEKTRILIADENPVGQLTLFQFLTEAGYEVVIAESGTAAIAELRKADHPPVAILDCILPGMTGLEICKRMRSVEKPVYLILSGDQCGEQELAAARDAGADRFLPKPIVRMELLALVDSGLQTIARQRESGGKKDVQTGRVPPEEIV